MSHLRRYFPNKYDGDEGGNLVCSLAIGWVLQHVGCLSFGAVAHEGDCVSCADEQRTLC